MTLSLSILPPTLGRYHPERIACMRLRHAHYCERKGFERLRENGCEEDDFDGSAWFFTVAEERDILIGCIRAVPSLATGDLLPMEFEFRGALERPTYEVSRAIISPPKTNRGNRKELAMKTAYLLYQGAYGFFSESEIEVVYAIIEPAYLEKLQSLFCSESVQAMGPSYPVQKGRKILEHVPTQFWVEKVGRHFDSPKLWAFEPMHTQRPQEAYRTSAAA